MPRAYGRSAKGVYRQRWRAYRRGARPFPFTSGIATANLVLSSVAASSSVGNVTLTVTDVLQLSAVSAQSSVGSVILSPILVPSAVSAQASDSVTLTVAVVLTLSSVSALATVGGMVLAFPHQPVLRRSGSLVGVALGQTTLRRRY